jgi:hypothetical protein
LLQNDFERLLQEAVDEGLSALGDSARQAIYYHLESNFGIRKEEIPGRVEAFAEAIMQIFGPGATFLEILIMKRLHEKVRLNLREHSFQSLEFTEYVAMAKQSFAKRKANRATEESAQ